MLNLGQLVNTVQKNCHISDARHAGDFTLCIFLLKMREFFRWENDIPFARDLPKEEVGAWLQEREGLWSDLEESPFESLPLEGRQLDPFDADSVNRELIPQGYVYSGGYGRFSKPHFFLGSLLKKEKRAGYTIYGTDEKTFEFKRGAYDIEGAAKKIFATDLERNFGNRLFLGV